MPTIHFKELKIRLNRDLNLWYTIIGPSEVQFTTLGIALSFINDL